MTGRASGARDALIAWAIVLVLVAALVHINITLPYLGHFGSALVAVLFIAAAWAVGKWRGEELEDYGFHEQPVARGLKFAALGIAIVFPLFVVGYLAFYQVACHWDLLHHLVPAGMAGICNAFHGLGSIHAPPITSAFGEFCLVQLVVVALPEELFFRGCLLTLLEQRFPPKRRIAGGGIGWALVISAAAFALIHLPKDGDPRALATFFPGLLFGWMRSATGSLLAPTITHASSNILVRLLETAVIR